MNVDVAIDYDFVHTLPSTELKLATQELYKSPFEEFITKYHQQFIEGWSSTQCLETAFNELNDGSGSYSKKLITLELIKYCGKAKQIRRGHIRMYVYTLMPAYIERFRPNSLIPDEDIV
jgi:uncharacterized protein YbgA (DUF1722 family)